ncbi:acyl-CoA dehydrogenase family protein [Streptomyces sp. NPDC056656]|uniref:acyl-CoA dehydrogenase family protein n=1 Tax=Streptomyces sp. NPDC056656 TaxID=3345895 RepID=UPI003680DC28
MTSAIFAERSLYEDDHELLRETVRAFVDKHATPHAERWRAEGKVDRELGHRRPVGAERAGCGGRSFAGLGGQGRAERSPPARHTPPLPLSGSPQYGGVVSARRSLR